jgi:hypothetical protein
MIDAGSLEFAHARIWARWGARPGETLWRRIETTRELGAVIDLVRASALASWVEGLDAQAGVHAIESALRRQWRARVLEVAAWMPSGWHDALRWCAALIDLPLAQHLARGGALPPWLDDAAIGDMASFGDPERVLEAWLARWRAMCPAGTGREAIEHRLLPLLAAHAASFAAPSTQDGWALRRTLHARLARLLRRAVAEPMAPFAFLALTALDVERLRGELVRRAAFPAPRAVVA